MIEFNAEQEKVINEAVEWYKNSSEQVFQINGSAGTGKTTVLKEIINRLKLPEYEVAPMAYTGAASIVLRNKGFRNAKTTHSWFYKVIEVPDKTKKDHYTNRYRFKLKCIPKELPSEIKLICIDEAGTVPESMKPTIMNSKRKIIALGDLNQLPPIADKPAFLYEGKVHTLSQIMRQNEGSGIVYLANEILAGHPLKEGTYGNAIVINSNDIKDNMLTKSDIILCGLNRTKGIYNKRCRELNGIDPQLKIPCHGEKIICRKNNWFFEVDGISMANGLCGEIKNYPSMHSFNKDGSGFYVDFKPTMFNMVFKHALCSYKFFSANKDIKDIIRTSKNYREKNHIVGNLFELGYAITTHLSQGSQYKKGMYISEYMGRDIMQKLDYVGITRFSDSCIFVLRSKRFF